MTYRLDVRRPGRSRSLLDTRIMSFYLSTLSEAVEATAEWCLSAATAPRGGEVVLSEVGGPQLYSLVVRDPLPIPQFAYRAHGIPWFATLSSSSSSSDDDGALSYLGAGDLAWAQLIGMTEDARSIALAELGRQWGCSPEKALEIVFEDELSDAVAEVRGAIDRRGRGTISAADDALYLRLSATVERVGRATA